MGRRWESRSLAERLVSEWHSVSGRETQASFCRRHSIRVESFRRWRNRLSVAVASPEQDSSASSFLEVTPPRAASSALHDDGFVAEVQTPRGSTIRIRGSISSSLLKELLASC